MNDAIGNQVPLAIGSVFLVSPHIASGRLRAIAVTSARPDPPALRFAMKFSRYIDLRR